MCDVLRPRTLRRRSRGALAALIASRGTVAAFIASRGASSVSIASRTATRTVLRLALAGFGETVVRATFGARLRNSASRLRHDCASGAFRADERAGALGGVALCNRLAFTDPLAEASLLRRLPDPGVVVVVRPVALGDVSVERLAAGTVQHVGVYPSAHAFVGSLGGGSLGGGTLRGRRLTTLVTAPALAPRAWCVVSERGERVAARAAHLSPLRLFRRA
mmetsp:Transcript_2248/g.8161  ORF Transcript_2248/g.8161 Transcript_2248/m.8161 type:complete len:220 (-) Transcript_2248:373-1032(-)